MKFSIGLLPLLILTSYAINSNAQTLAVKEKLPDGEYLITVDGVEQRTLTQEHAQSIKDRLGRLAILEEALPACQQINTDYRARLATAVAQGQGWQTLFESEHKLRTDMAVFVKRPSRFTSWLEKPIPKLIFTIAPVVVPALIKR